MNPRISSHLDFPIPAGRRQEWAESLAEPPPVKETGDRQKVFIVRLGAEWFGFPPAMLVATQPDVRPRRLPHRANSMLEGLVNADGRVIVCLALEKAFEVLPGDGGDDAPRLLIFQSGTWTFAARARQVLGIGEVNLDRMQPLAESASENLLKSARGLVVHDGRAMVCLDEEMLVKQLTGLVR